MISVRAIPSTKANVSQILTRAGLDVVPGRQLDLLWWSKSTINRPNPTLTLFFSSQNFWHIPCIPYKRKREVNENENETSCSTASGSERAQRRAASLLWVQRGSSRAARLLCTRTGVLRACARVRSPGATLPRTRILMGQRILVWLRAATRLETRLLGCAPR